MSDHLCNVHVDGLKFTPYCTCGQWTGTTTYFNADVDRQHAAHVASVGAPAPKPVGHTYDAGRRHNWRTRA